MVVIETGVHRDQVTSITWKITFSMVYLCKLLFFYCFSGVTAITAFRYKTLQQERDGRKPLEQCPSYAIQQGKPCTCPFMCWPGSSSCCAQGPCFTLAAPSAHQGHRLQCSPTPSLQSVHALDCAWKHKIGSCCLAVFNPSFVIPTAVSI